MGRKPRFDQCLVLRRQRQVVQFQRAANQILPLFHRQSRKLLDDIDKTHPASLIHRLPVFTNNLSSGHASRTVSHHALCRTFMGRRKTGKGSTPSRQAPQSRSDSFCQHLVTVPTTVSLIFPQINMRLCGTDPYVRRINSEFIFRYILRLSLYHSWSPPKNVSIRIKTKISKLR
jgi:hypothetical protein